MIRAPLGSRVRALGRAILGRRQPPLVDGLARRDPRWDTFVQALEYVNFEGVPGDIVECGVFGGLSLALLARAASFDPRGAARGVVGIDSFDGLPASSEPHARWRAGDCGALRETWHPVLAAGEPVTPAATEALFDRCGLPRPTLHVGRFAEVVPRVIPARHPAIAVLHVDCDLYESARDVLFGAAPGLQDGTLLLFDDWFHYKGHPRKGEARALAEFLDAHPEWQAVHWRPYATFCNAFIAVRR